AADEELHREIVDAFGVLAFVSLLRTQPPLRKNVSHGAGESLVALARAGRLHGDDVIEHEVPIVECVVRPEKRYGAAPVLLKEVCEAGGFRGARQRCSAHHLLPFLEVIAPWSSPRDQGETAIKEATSAANRWKGSPRLSRRPFHLPVTPDQV